jgi:hypothetical protein
VKLDILIENRNVVLKFVVVVITWVSVQGVIPKMRVIQMASAHVMMDFLVLEISAF